MGAIISVGYQAVLIHGTQFRIWATSAQKDHLARGYALHRNLLAEKCFGKVRQMLALLSNMLEDHNLDSGDQQAGMKPVDNYDRIWRLFWLCDEDAMAQIVKRSIVELSSRWIQ